MYGEAQNVRDGKSSNKFDYLSYFAFNVVIT